MTDQASITIYRRVAGNWSGRFSDLSVFADGEKVGAMASGKEEHIKIPPGSHTMLVKGLLCRSNELKVHLAPQENKYLECGMSLLKGLAWSAISLVLFFIIFLLFLRFFNHNISCAAAATSVVGVIALLISPNEIIYLIETSPNQD